MENERKLRKIDWYRSPVERDQLAALNQRSDWKGLRQALGHLGILLVTGGVAWYASAQGLWLLFGGRSPKNTVGKRVDKKGQMVDPCLRNESEVNTKQGEKDAGPN
jgi:hypothetical protein